MGANLWLSGILAVCLFWCVGVYNRITRLRARSLEAFAAVAANMHRYRILGPGAHPSIEGHGNAGLYFSSSYCNWNDWTNGLEDAQIVSLG